MLLSLIHTLYSSLQHVLNLLTLLCLHRLPINGPQRRRSFSFSVQRLWFLMAVAYLTTGLGVATQRLTTMGAPPPPTPPPGATVCDDLRARRISILQIYPLHGPTENTTSHNLSIVACITVATLTWYLLCRNLVTDTSSG
jgi:hypothetical protein